eukprot:5256355-Prymnesium_polylepis.1
MMYVTIYSSWDANRSSDARTLRRYSDYSIDFDGFAGLPVRGVAGASLRERPTIIERRVRTPAANFCVLRRGRFVILVVKVTMNHSMTYGYGARTYQSPPPTS